MDWIVKTIRIIHNWLAKHTRVSFLNIKTMDNTFDWRLVQTFLVALDRGSLLGAARQLGTSQPTVGRQIAELEQQLGAVLFERTGRGLKPTELALTLATPARQMAAAALALNQQLHSANDEVAGTVRITASQPVACYLLPDVLAAMRQALPSVQVALVVSNNVSNLLEREADIAIRMVRPDQSSLVAKLIAHVGVSACASRTYLSLHGEPLVPTDLLRHHMVGYDQNDDIIKGFSAMGHTISQSAFGLRTDDMIAYWQAVRAGMGVGFVADYMLDLHTDVVRVLPGLTLPSLPVWLTVHREVRTSARIRAVYDFLARAVPLALAAPPAAATMAPMPSRPTKDTP
jgi:DNA-binding transcriptional LysR family regulator